MMSDRRGKRDQPLSGSYLASYTERQKSTRDCPRRRCNHLRVGTGHALLRSRTLHQNTRLVVCGEHFFMRAWAGFALAIGLLLSFSFAP
jgi:hypothetical protein